MAVTYFEQAGRGMGGREFVNARGHHLWFLGLCLRMDPCRCRRMYRSVRHEAVASETPGRLALRVLPSLNGKLLNRG